MKRIAVIFFLIGTLLLTMLVSAQAQSAGYELSWFTVNAGSGVSTGGEYHINGTAGQPNAGLAALSGGEFTLAGGFWSGETDLRQIFLPVMVR